MKLKIGTRGSRLALIQTQRVVEKLKASAPELKVEIKQIKTAGDLRSGKIKSGMFVNEINHAVLESKIDIGIHSLKDLPTKLPKGIMLACVPERLAPNDALISRDGSTLRELSANSVIGTSSPRRKAEIGHLQAGLTFKDIRGNIETRIKKMEDGVYDAIIVALAALERLDILEKVAQKFELDEVVPAAGQGALAVVCREGEMPDFLRMINDELAWKEVTCERAFLEELGVDCRACAGAVARTCSDGIELITVVHDEGRRLFKLSGQNPIELGERAGEMARRARST